MVGTGTGIGGTGLSPLGGGGGTEEIIDPITGTPATVYPDGSLKVRDTYTNPAGGGASALSDYDGATILQSGNILKAMLIELRVLTKVLFEANLIKDDPEQWRADEIQTIGDDAMNAAA